MSTALPFSRSPRTARPPGLAVLLLLAAPEFGGRLTGTPGNQAAAEYLAETLVAAGLVPLSGMESMLDYYQQPVLRSDGAPALAYRAVGAQECPARLTPERILPYWYGPVFQPRVISRHRFR